MEGTNVMEYVETTEVVSDVAENIVTKSGMSFVKKAGIVGAVCVAAVCVYGAVKLIKNKKTDKNVDDDNYIDEDTDFEYETEETN